MLRGQIAFSVDGRKCPGDESGAVSGQSSVACPIRWISTRPRMARHAPAAAPLAACAIRCCCRGRPCNHQRAVACNRVQHFVVRLVELRVSGTLRVVSCAVQALQATRGARVRFLPLGTRCQLGGTRPSRTFENKSVDPHSPYFAIPFHSTTACDTVVKIKCDYLSRNTIGQGGRG